MNEKELHEEAKTNILRNRQAVKEFSHYPKVWLNKLIGLRYNLSDPYAKQVRDYIKFEKKNKSREVEKFDTILVV